MEMCRNGGQKWQKRKICWLLTSAYAALRWFEPWRLLCCCYFRTNPGKVLRMHRGHNDYEKVTKPKDFTFHRKFTIKIVNSLVNSLKWPQMVSECKDTGKKVFLNDFLAFLWKFKFYEFPSNSVRNKNQLLSLTDRSRTFIWFAIKEFRKSFEKFFRSSENAFSTSESS